MPREANPNFLLYSHVKIKQRVNTKSPQHSPVSGGAESTMDVTRQLERIPEFSPPKKRPTILDFQTLSRMA